MQSSTDLLAVHCNISEAKVFLGSLRHQPEDDGVLLARPPHCIYWLTLQWVCIMWAAAAIQSNGFLEMFVTTDKHLIIIRRMLVTWHFIYTTSRIFWSKGPTGAEDSFRSRSANETQQRRVLTIKCDLGGTQNYCSSLRSARVRAIKEVPDTGQVWSFLYMVSYNEKILPDI